MPGPLLYSTNVFLKYLLNATYCADKHYLWCSESFDSSKNSVYTTAAMVAPSSDPCAIYRRLSEDCRKQDRHSAKIGEQKLSINAVAVQWRDAGRITTDQLEDIAYQVASADFLTWRPVIAVIPRALVQARLQPVPAHRRASLGPEFIIADADRSEFDLIEI